MQGLVFNVDGLVQAGTVNRLIEHLTNAKIHDLTYMKHFLLTYQAFVTPKIFFAKLVKRYGGKLLLYLINFEIQISCTSTTGCNGYRKFRPKCATSYTTTYAVYVSTFLFLIVTVGVCNVLKTWIDISFHEFDPELLQEMEQFAEKVLIPGGNASLAQKIQGFLQKKKKTVCVIFKYCVMHLPILVQQVKPQLNYTFGQAAPQSRE